MLISKNQIKQVRSLGMKKYREESRLFIAEGRKCTGDLLPHLHCKMLIVQEGESIPATWDTTGTEILEASGAAIKQMSQLCHPQGIIGVFEQPQHSLPDPQDDLLLALDGVQDPGNLGTIIRTADWFGIRDIICSKDTAEVYNPKTVQATMGALARVSVHYTDLPAFLQSYHHPIYGTLLDGKDINRTDLSTPGIIVMGNEGNGISEAVRKLITHPILIPSYPAGYPTSESLNVSIATGIVLAKFRE